MSRLVLKIFFLTLGLTTLLTTNTSSINAQEYCCNVGYRYCAPLNGCTRITDSCPSTSWVAMNCLPGEYCFANVSHPRGTCSTSPNPTLTPTPSPTASPTPIPECRGETTGNPGYCFWNNFDCVPPNDDEGNGGCPPTAIGWPQRCCVWPQLPGQPTLPPITGAIIQLTPRPALDPQCSGWARIYTAIGCIPVGNLNNFSVFILRWAIGIAGGVSFILIVYASFLIMTSSGNPRQIQAGRELLTSAIAGLMLLIFSVFVLEVIGVRILRIPGF